jgi:hypothetical protein
MAVKSKDTPCNMSVKEASVYWDTHSVADVPSHAVRFEYRPGEKTGTVTLAEDLVRKLVRRAQREHVSVEALRIFGSGRS